MRKYVIYQLPISHPNIFREELAKSGDYVPVWQASLPDCLECDVMELLEMLYTKFNMEHPENFAGHSLSVSDLILLINFDPEATPDNPVRKLYQCRSLGWSEVTLEDDDSDTE
jgi:hypothetical protein